MSGATSAALVCSIVLIVWAGTMRALAGTWLQPSAFFALWWCFAGIVPLIFAPEEYVGVNAIVWVMVACIAVSLGALAGNGGFRTRRPRVVVPPTAGEVRILSFVLLISFVLGVASGVESVIEAGVPLSDVFDIQRLVVLTNQMYITQHVEVQETSRGVTQALLPFVYLAPAVGGMLFVIRPTFRWRFLSLASVFPSLLVTVLQTTKAALLFSMILWLSGYFATRLRKGKLAVFTKGHVILGASAFFAGTVLFLGTSLARLGSTDLGLLGTATGKLFGSAFGHMTVLSQWLHEYWISPFSPTLGKWTFAGPLELAGIGKRIPGLFEALIELITGDTSNIYTAFRPLIQDFTLPGAIAALALTGFVGGVSFRMVANGKVRWVPVLMGTYATIFWTPITWFWIYNSLTATLIALELIMFIVRRKRSQAPTWNHLRDPIAVT
jgi:oligosaccharide repeat unit polymerase